MQIVLLYFVYSIFGRLLEVIYKFIQTKKFVNRGFTIGPYCLIYGDGGILLYLLTDTNTNPILFFFACMFICGVIEYFLSWLMESLFHARWWDYSHYKFNLNGRVCLKNLILFGIIGSIGIYIITPNALKIMDLIPLEYQNLIAIILIIICSLDMIISVKIIGSIKSYISKSKKDETEKISKKVKKILIEKGKLYARTVLAYSDFKIPEKYISKIRKKKK